MQPTGLGARENSAPCFVLPKWVSLANGLVVKKGEKRVARSLATDQKRFGDKDYALWPTETKTAAVAYPPPKI